MSGPTRNANLARLVRCSAGCGTMVWLAGALPTTADAGFVCPSCMTGAEMIAGERRRQVDVEGYSVEGDVVHQAKGELAVAAWCYLGDLLDPDLYDDETMPAEWPWPHYGEDGEVQGCSWKPTPDDPIRQLVKAGALIAAEIDRRIATAVVVTCVHCGERLWVEDESGPWVDGNADDGCSVSGEGHAAS